MKPEFPYLNAIASKYIATPLVVLTAIFLSTSVFRLPAQEIYPMVFSAFGITIALSGICFTVATSPSEEYNIKYAGEKFLHSSLLLIQLVSILYIKTEIVKLSFIKTNPIAMGISSTIISVLFAFISAVALWTFYFGFDMLNDEMWRKYKKRIEKIRNEIEENIIKNNNTDS